MPRSVLAQARWRACSAFRAHPCGSVASSAGRALVVAGRWGLRGWKPRPQSGAGGMKYLIFAKSPRFPNDSVAFLGWEPSKVAFGNRFRGFGIHFRGLGSRSRNFGTRFRNLRNCFRNFGSHRRNLGHQFRNLDSRSRNLGRRCLNLAGRFRNYGSRSRDLAGGFLNVGRPPRSFGGDGRGVEIGRRKPPAGCRGGGDGGRGRALSDCLAGTGALKGV